MAIRRGVAAQEKGFHADTGWAKFSGKTGWSWGRAAGSLRQEKDKGHRSTTDEETVSGNQIFRVRSTHPSWPSGEETEAEGECLLQRNRLLSRF